MILDMQKVLFVGPEDRKKDFLERLQKEGVVQIEDYAGNSFQKEENRVDSTKAEEIHTAAKLLKKYEDEYPHYEQREVKEKINDPVDFIHGLHKKIQSLQEKQAELEYKKQYLHPWGDFSLKTIEEIEKASHTVVQFWEVPHKYFASVKPDAEMVHVTSVGQHEFFVTFSEKRIEIENCIEQSVDTDPKTIAHQLKKVHDDQVEYIGWMHALMKYREPLQKRYLDELNTVHFSKALASMVRPLDGMLFALQGWIRKKDVQKLREAVSEYGAQLETIKPEKGEKIPTSIENNGMPELGQDLVMFYDTPAQSDWDPSGWVFLAFVLFFSMIMGDGGYGLTLFLLLLFIRIKTGKKAKGSIVRFLNMSMVLTFATFVYGTLFSGFYGVNLPIPFAGSLKESISHPWFDAYLDFKNMTDGDAAKNGILMRVSVLIGLGHISLSLLLKALRDFSQKQFIRPFSNFAWIVIMWVFYHLYSETGGKINEFFAAMTTPPFGYVMGGALGVVFLTSAGTLHPGKLIGGGLGGIYNGVQFFSDVLSYIRIFALGLSGSLIAIVFNDLGTQVMSVDFAVLGVPAGILILVFGHLLNIGLCLMGAVIHGLRLNFLEYYRWSFDGDGRPFKPFKDLLA